MADKPLNISTMQGGSALVPQPMMSQPMVTMPTIPNPTPPPPQKVAVVTPAAAKADLTQKQQTTNAVALAMQQHTQGLLNTMGQPISQAGGSPVPTAQPQQGQPQGQAQTPTQTTVAAPAAGGAAAPTVGPAGTSPVTLPNGAKANYNQGAGTMTSEDGKPLIYQNGQWVDAATGQAPLPAGSQTTTGTGQTKQTTTTPGGVPSTGDPVSDYILGQMQTNQQALDMASATHQQQLSQILNGTFPLTADQQAQVAGLKGQLDTLRQQQEKANADSVRATKILGIRSGRYQYQPGAQNTEVTNAIDDGITKLRDFDIQAASAVASLKKGFLDDDYKVINQSYEDLQGAITAKNTTLTQMQTVVKNATDMATARLNQQKAELDIQETLVNNVAQSALSAVLKADGTLDLDMLQQIADEQGIDPNTLYGAVQKAQKDEIVFQQAESKFASDQLQAGATLGLTQANTQKAYADIAKTKADTAKTVAETGGGAGVGGSSTALRQQPNYNTLTAKQKTQADSLNNLVRAMGEYKTYLDDHTGSTGGNLFGGDSAVLETKLNSIIFAAAQAEGTGALQAADRAVIEKIIPNPTTVGGTLNAWFKGGKQGELDKIDDQIAKYTSNLGTYGLTPTQDAMDAAAPKAPADAASPANGADGALYGFPGYHSDGTQWVPNQ